jgi:hypothetical protein
MLNIILSKDRPMQLWAHLESLQLNFIDWQKHKFILIYKSAPEYADNYMKVFTTFCSHPNFEIHEEFSFENQLKEIIRLDDESTTNFLCDDSIWINPFEYKNRHIMSFEKDKFILSFSLRMHPKVYKCHAMGNITTPPPISMNSDNMWDWTSVYLKGDWCYPMSVDGHIFKTYIIRDLINKINFENPNYLEGYLSPIAPKNIPFMKCFSESKLISIPLNMTQSTHPKRAMGVTLEQLNKMFSAGKRIDIKKIQGFKNISPHQEIDLEYI